MNDLLLILSCKRHEMLNQLQMVSGYLQLNKQEKAREYLAQMAQELTWESEICNCKSDRVAMALLTVQSRLNLAGIHLKLQVQADLSGASLPEEQMVAVLKGLEDYLKAYLQDNPQAISLDWGLEIGGYQEGTRWRFSLPCEKQQLDYFSQRLKQLVQGTPGGNQCTISANETGLVLFVPKESKL